jgi:hypothetical protein
MPRMPYAMKALIDEVAAARKTAKFDLGDEDGLGVYRSVTFDKATTKWLGHAFDYVEDDRIIGYSVSKDQMTVLFSHRSSEADRKDGFLIADAQTVAASEAS